MIRLAIEVLQKDIDKGVCDSPSKCALAVAIKRRFKGDVILGRWDGSFYDKTGEITRCNLTDGRVRFIIPPETWAWIEKFDTLRRVEPTILMLDIFREATIGDLSSPDSHLGSP